MQKGRAAPPDYFSFPGAKKLASRIAHQAFVLYGLRAQVRVIAEAGVKDGRNLYVVRSNITFDEKGFPKVVL